MKHVTYVGFGDQRFLSKEELVKLEISFKEDDAGLLFDKGLPVEVTNATAHTLLTDGRLQNEFVESDMAAPEDVDETPAPNAVDDNPGADAEAPQQGLGDAGSSSMGPAGSEVGAHGSDVGQSGSTITPT